MCYIPVRVPGLGHALASLERGRADQVLSAGATSQGCLLALQQGPHAQLLLLCRPTGSRRLRRGARGPACRPRIDRLLMEKLPYSLVGQLLLSETSLVISKLLLNYS